MQQMSSRQNYRDVLRAYDRMGQGMVVSPLDGTAVVAAAPAGAACGIACCPVPEGTVGHIVPVGFERVCIPPCGEVTVRMSIPAPATILALFVPASIAGCLSLKNWNIGRWQAFGNCDPVPAEMFSCCELDENALVGVAVAANTEICLTVINECKRNIDFRAAVKALVCDVC